MKDKGKLKPLTFLYGFGAAVVLVGAMFKFLGWNYANQMFVVGLSIEAFVFLVSAFERTVEDKEYNWDNVFPQLNGGEGESADTKGYAQAMDDFGKTLSALNKEMSDMGAALKEMRSGMEKVGNLSSQVDDLSKEVSSYNGHLKQMNAKFQEFSKK
jgi:gliding motility-associated protein GldL